MAAGSGEIAGREKFHEPPLNAMADRVDTTDRLWPPCMRAEKGSVNLERMR